MPDEEVPPYGIAAGGVVLGDFEEESEEEHREACEDASGAVAEARDGERGERNRSYFPKVEILAPTTERGM
jgi:hypothetical protein